MCKTTIGFKLTLNQLDNVKCSSVRRKHSIFANKNIHNNWCNNLTILWLNCCTEFGELDWNLFASKWDSCHSSSPPLTGNTGPWLASNQSRDLNNELWLVIYFVRSVAALSSSCFAAWFILIRNERFLETLAAVFIVDRIFELTRNKGTTQEFRWNINRTVKSRHIK